MHGWLPNISYTTSGSYFEVKTHPGPKKPPPVDALPAWNSICKCHCARRRRSPIYDAFIGETGFLLQGDLPSMQQLNTPVKIVVFNNSALSFVELEMKATGALENGTTLVHPRLPPPQRPQESTAAGSRTRLMSVPRWSKL